MSEGITPNQLTPVVPVFKATVTLTDAQIKALPTTPIQVVAAPGPGKMLVCLFAALICGFQSGAYTNIDADQSAVLLKAESGWAFMGGIWNDVAASFTFMTDYFGVATDRIVELPPKFGCLFVGAPLAPVSDILENVENLPMQIAAFNSGNFTGGNAANTLKVISLYAELDVGV